MQIESNKPDSSMMPHILYLSLAAILLVIIAAVILISWRGHKKNTPPYTTHPLSQMCVPERAGSSAA